MTKNNFFIPIFAIALLSGGLVVSDAYAHQSPVGCFGNAMNFGLFRAPATVVNGGQVAFAGHADNLPGTACDVEAIDVDFVQPAADGTSTGTIVHLFTGDFNATLNDQRCWAGNATISAACTGGDDISTVAGLLFNINVNPGVVTAESKILFQNGILHDSSSDSAVNDDRTLNTEVLQGYTFSTLSNNTSLVTAPVVNPADVVTISAVTGVNGNWTVSADLVKPDASTSAASCVTTPQLNTDAPTDVTCTVAASFSAAGQYCWDVTVTETGSNYDSASDGTQLGSEDAANECFTIPEETGEGCTPGYYRNNLALNIDGNDQSATQWYVLHHTTFADAFTVDPIETKDNYDEDDHKGGGKSGASPNAILAEAIWAQGGGINALARHATAALLNSANPEVDYSLTGAEIIALVQAALPDGDIDGAKSILAGFNEDGCPVDQQPREIED